MPASPGQATVANHIPGGTPQQDACLRSDYDTALATEQQPSLLVTGLLVIDLSHALAVLGPHSFLCAALSSGLASPHVLVCAGWAVLYQLLDHLRWIQPKPATPLPPARTTGC